MNNNATMTMKKTPGRSPEDRMLDARQKRLGEQLKRLYDDVAREPVPDDFLALLAEAEKKAKDSGDKSKS